MPNVTVYIRKEDMQTWRDLPNKAEWLSWHLRERASKGESSENTTKNSDDVHTGVIPMAVEEIEGMKLPPMQNPVRTKRDVLNDINSSKEQLEEDLRYCQDPETRNELEKAHSERQAVLWEEWRSLQ